MTNGPELPDGPTVDLPDELADHAAEQLLAVTGRDRDQAFAALLAAHPAHAHGLRRLRSDLGGAEGLLDSTFSTPGPEPTTRIGTHRVIRVLGEGAFGIVYLCAQEEPIVRQVAIKVLRPGVGDEKTLRRFAAERQLLAALNHPAITQVFDAGVLADGRPFFVMEHVDGEPMRSYCEARLLSCQDRLRLFVELCRGVSHAHKRSIVHRDLKPANVLVVETDHGPMPKIIDFGIAKALFASDDAAGPRTDAGRVIGTPGYMSPEQAAGLSDDIDERADVFALGVMLYELLTGELPWPRGAAATDSEPVRPSARITTSTGAAPSSPPTQRRQLAAELRGDLDWITLKALARLREERYPSVAALAEDIERHLRKVPVSVGPPSTRYRLRKFVRRNRATVVTIGSALLLVGIGLGLAFAYGRWAGAEVKAAREAVDATFEDTKSVVSRLLARANDPAMRDAPQGDSARQALLEDALSFYDDFLQSRPTEPGLRVGRCNALLSLSQVHLLLGQLSRAASTAAEAVLEADELLAAAPDDRHRQGLLGRSLRAHGRALALASRHKDARALLTAAVQHLEICAAADPANHGQAYSGALREAAATLDDNLDGELTDQTLSGFRASLMVLDKLRRDHPQLTGLAEDHALACLGVAGQLHRMRRYEQAATVLSAAESDLAMVTTHQKHVATMLWRLQGRVAWDLDRRKQAIACTMRAVDAAEHWVAEQPLRSEPLAWLVRVLGDLGTFHNYVDAFDQSSQAFRRAIDGAEKMVQLFPEDPSRAVSLCAQLVQFSRILWDRFRREDLAEAASLIARAIAVNDKLDPSIDVGRRPRWLLRSMQAGIADSLGEPTGAMWRAVDPELPTDLAACPREDREPLALAFLGVARTHLQAGEPEPTVHALAQAIDLIEQLKPESDKLLVEVGWIEAQLAFARGDHAAAAAAGERVLAARPTWYGCRRAADCLHLAWRSAMAGGAEQSVIADHQHKAAALYGKVIRTLQGDVKADASDPWYVVPWGFASVRLAELTAAEGDLGGAHELLAAAMPKLDAVRAAAVADQWDETIFADGQALQTKLQGDRDHR